MTHKSRHVVVKKDGEIAVLRTVLRKHEENLSVTKQTNGEARLFQLFAHTQQSFTTELEQRRVFEVGLRRRAHLIYLGLLVF